jgi:stage II sporulation protein AA (anti-sigma F factor antagonist)
MKERRSMEVQREHHADADAMVFHLSGKMTGTRECYEFLDDLRDEVHAGSKNIVLDLKAVERISSPGIGILAACYTSVTRAGGRLCIVAVPEPVIALLKIVCLWDVLPRYASEQEALTALKQPR